MRRPLAYHLFVAALFVGCSEQTPPDFISSGIIESHTYSVSPTNGGRILTMMVEEGSLVQQGRLCAIIDTIPVKLKMQELEGRKAELVHTIAARNAEIEAMKTEVRGLAREFGRISKLVDKGSAAQQKKDELGTRVKAADHGLEAAQQMRSALNRTRHVLEAQQASLQNQLEECYVRSPANGIVLSRYRNRGEMATPANPLFDVGAFDTMHVDFFVSQVMLSEVQIGRRVSIRLDRSDKENKELFVDAEVVWISEEAEFTPGNVQTREARNELVFRVRARTANKDRILKRGLPVEVWRAQ
ncbi:MAG: HlyD family secretion protein [Chitinivibrionales bacterium]